MQTLLQKKEAELILEKLSENLSITETQHAAAVRSYQTVGNWLTSDDSELADYNPVVSPQGSFIIGTTIQTIDPDGDIDLDIVCELNGKRADWTQKDVKEIVGEQLASHKKLESILDDEGRRCWTLRYRENGSISERYHMDILPAVNTHGYSVIQEKAFSNLDEQSMQDLVLSITDKERMPEYETSLNPHEWLQSNPFGYAKWFIGIAQEIKGVRSKMFSLNEAVNPAPKFQHGRLPLQIVVQLLKRHRDMMFKDALDDEKEQKPISCIITTLAARAYKGEDSVVEALLNIVQTMEYFIENRFSAEHGRDIKWVANPTNDAENFADRWAITGSKREELFYKWLTALKDDLGILGTNYNKIMLSESLKKSFGETPVIKTFSDVATDMRLLTEQGNNFIDKREGLIGKVAAASATVAKVAPHTFFGDD